MILRAMCKSKIHHAVITEANVNYIGSIAIDADLLDHANVIPGEKVHVWNINNGERLETYALPAPRGSGSVIMNGAAARRCMKGDKIIVVAFALTDEIIKPAMILVDEKNQFKDWLGDNQSELPSGVVVETIAAPVNEL